MMVMHRKCNASLAESRGLLTGRVLMFLPNEASWGEVRFPPVADIMKTRHTAEMKLLFLLPLLIASPIISG